MYLVAHQIERHTADNRLVHVVEHLHDLGQALFKLRPIQRRVLLGGGRVVQNVRDHIQSRDIGHGRQHDLLVIVVLDAEGFGDDAHNVDRAFRVVECKRHHVTDRVPLQRHVFKELAEVVIVVRVQEVALTAPTRRFFELPTEKN